MDQPISKENQTQMVHNSSDAEQRLKTRRAEEKDVPMLIELFRLWHDESALSEIPFSPSKVQAMADKALGPNPAHMCAVVEHNGELVGGLYAVIGDYYISDETQVTTIHGFFVHPSVRKSVLSGKVALRLFKAAKQWSEHMGSSYLLFHVTSGVKPAETDRFLRKLGCRPLGGNYAIKA
ncbi:hypothetical protein PsAD26_02559 [Pseudovibrio sp. Ad26]|nr:hypothetical protein PsAD26_02559 [Pseudovibrio sp. Ad26]